MYVFQDKRLTSIFIVIFFVIENRTALNIPILLIYRILCKIGHFEIYRRLAQRSNVFHVWLYHSYVYVAETGIANFQRRVCQAAHQSPMEI